MTNRTRATELAMIAAAQLAVRNGTRWYTASELTALAALQGVITAPAPSEWIEHSRMFAIKLDGERRFPAYGLDPRTLQPLPVMASVLSILAGIKSPWSLAAWFEAVNSYLGGIRPRELMTTDPDRVIFAASVEADDIEHG